MKRIGRIIINPFMAFIGIQLVWILVVVFWVYWFMGKHRELRSIAQKYSPELLQGGIDWFILIEGLLLLVAILAGVYVIFLYWQRQAALYRAQRNFIAQVTHELKSPLASLQLHLETIRRRRLPKEKLDVLVDTMLGDTDRLQTLINNLLTANRVEQKGLKLTLQSADFSELVTRYFRRHQFSLPRAGNMQLEVEPGLRVRLDEDAMETVFRNLLENAILYSTGAPQIRVALFREGRLAHLVFSDKGRGIEKKEQKKVFRMFYRIKRGKETIRGSGLGLFIVHAIVRLHRGNVRVESAGADKGTAFHILLPLQEPDPREQSP